YTELVWPLLLMFIGIFVVVAGLEKTVLTPEITAAAGHLRLDNSVVLAGITAVLSNIVSNVPAVLFPKAVVPGLGDPQRAWLVIAMACRQSHRRGAGGGARRPDRLLGLFLDRRIVEPADGPGRASLTVRLPFQFFILRS